jgi:hypothetical protein
MAVDRFSPRALAVLHAAGWRQGRSAPADDVTRVEWVLTDTGLDVNPAALAFLTEFLGLELTVSLPQHKMHSRCGVDPLSVMTWEAKGGYFLHEPEGRADLAAATGEPACPVGWIGDTVWLIGPSGRSFALHSGSNSLMRWGDTPEEALEHLCDPLYKPRSGPVYEGMPEPGTPEWWSYLAEAKRGRE